MDFSIRSKTQVQSKHSFFLFILTIMTANGTVRSTARLSFRSSDFCRRRDPLRLAVKIQTGRKRLRNEGSAFASTELFVRLSIKDGDLVWVESNEGDSIAVPVYLKVDPDEKDSELLTLHPTTAASLACACAWFDLPEDGARVWIQPCTDKPSEAATVTLRPLGRPVPNRNFQTTTLSSTIEFPSMGNTPRLLTLGSLLAVEDNTEIYVYEVYTINESTIQASFVNKTIYTSSHQTVWKMEPYPSSEPTRRLPRHRMESVPHPSAPTLQSMLLLPSSSPPTHKMVHVFGSHENHVDHLVRATADRLGMRYLPVHGLARFAHATGYVVSTGGLIDRLAGIKAALVMARQSAPCVLHLLGMNEEVSATDEPVRVMEEQQMWTALLGAMETFESTGESFWKFAPAIIVVLSTTSPLRPGPWMQNLVFPSVSLSIPDEMYARHVWDDDGTFDETILLGRTAAELVKLKGLYNAKVSKSPIEPRRVLEELCCRLDSQKETVITNIPTVRWDDVGGLAHVRSEVMDAIELPLRHPDLFQGNYRSGILLYGPPGTGKTLVAKAVATECGLPFLSVKGPELLGSYVGESEANVRQIFGTARLAAQQSKSEAAILFFDELDSLAPKRGGVGDGGGVMERVVSTLLSELDGRQSKGRVFMIGATNRPDLLDPSLLRPGRLDRLVYLGLATSTDDRAKILAALIRKFRLEDDPLSIAKRVVDDFPPNLSGADFSAIASEALMNSLQRLCIEAENEMQERQAQSGLNISLDDILDEWSDIRLVPVVSTEDLVEAAKHMIPSISPEELQRYDILRHQFSSPVTQSSSAK